ncbi:hypothetical protein GCM10012280_66770 [Wenjunlia tyrosinilytica]|uniref:IPT/TIG domain-containing protein n=1 Tax=Wenjunlia tyrosinilytica TaxID=1544741 RepID=A0A918E2J9_9ACTN|nr:hypothetical protein GCM10012280_66770 [Wenjunlia tyrosinilytica]
MSFTPVSATQITTAAPAGSGTVNVTVTTPGGTSNGVPYTYNAVPVITGLSPNGGSNAGGTPVTITGTDFTGATLVKFGSVSVSFTPVSATQITTAAPAGSGTVNVTVTTPGGTSNGAAFTYNPVPAISALTPSQGPAAGANTVTITGTALIGATTVTFGTKPATITGNTAGQLTVTAPAAAVNVSVTAPGGTSNPLPYFYIPAPTVTRLDPTQGPVSGGNTVTITGSNLTLTGAVHFATGTATGITVLSDSQITAQAPSGSGTATVTVTTPGGTSLPGLGGAYYTYLGTPVVNALDPSQGPAAGGDVVTITGSNLTYTDEVRFGGIAVSFTAISDTKIVAAAPAGPPGTVPVTVHTPAGTSADTPYQYLA